MIEPDDPQDQGLSALYKASATEQPSAGLDARILAAARETASPPRAKTGSAFSRWRLPFALAATVLLTSTLTLMVREHDADPSSVTDGAVRAERGERTEPAPPPVKSAPSAPPATSAPPVVPAAKAPREAKVAPITPQAAPEARPAESAESASRADNEGLAGRAGGAGLPGRLGSAGLPGAAAGAAREVERGPVQWLAEIRKLRVEGKFDEAATQLAAFRRRYPEYPLPEDLRQP